MNQTCRRNLTDVVLRFPNEITLLLLCGLCCIRFSDKKSNDTCNRADHSHAGQNDNICSGIGHAAGHQAGLHCLDQFCSEGCDQEIHCYDRQVLGIISRAVKCIDKRGLAWCNAAKRKTGQNVGNDQDQLAAGHHGKDDGSNGNDEQTADNDQRCLISDLVEQTAENDPADAVEDRDQTDDNGKKAGVVIQNRNCSGCDGRSEEYDPKAGN